MKTLIPFFLLILMSITTWAQNADFMDRDILLKILDRKGRPINKVVVQSLSTDKAELTNRSGLFVFKDMSDKDTILLILPKFGKTLIPVTGLDSIVVTIRSKKLYSYTDFYGQNAMIAANRNDPGTILDVPELLRQRPYISMSELLQDQIPGLSVNTRGAPGSAPTVSIRGGMNSITQIGPPLVVLDGMEIGLLGNAENMVDVHSVKTIEVLKSAPEWGVRGANGVILINTK